jgi:hypothetical protein
MKRDECRNQSGRVLTIGWIALCPLRDGKGLSLHGLGRNLRTTILESARQEIFRNTTGVGLSEICAGASLSRREPRRLSSRERNVLSLSRKSEEAETG